MDDVYAINVLKTEFRRAYNSGDVERLMDILDDDLTDYSDGIPGGFRRSQPMLLGSGSRKAKSS